MADRAAWAKLLDKVEDENLRAPDDLFAVFPDRHEHWDEDLAAHASAAYFGDVNAAIALVDTGIPGWAWSLHSNGDVAVSLTSENNGLRRVKETHTATDDNHARALLIAFIKAKAEIEDD